MGYSRHILLRLFLTGTILLVASAAIWFGADLSRNKGLDDLHASNRQQLDQFISHLDARLSRFEFVPELIAKNRMLDELLLNPGNRDLTETVNRFLEDINGIIGASDSYLMDGNGLTLAASNWQDEQPFVGRNFSFRPYFSEAMQGQRGRYYALGSTSKKRGYYFSYPVTDTAGQIGVVVIKMDLSNIEEHWSGRDVQFIVTDSDGVIFITTQPQWLFRAIQPIDKDTRQQIRLSQRYLDINIKPLPTSRRQPYAENSTLWSIAADAARPPVEYLSLQQEMPAAGWSVMILAPLGEVHRNSLITAAILFLLIALLLLSAFLGWQRHRRRLERERFRGEAQRQLENEVSLRTADLRREVEEHKRTERNLRETQDELIQTAKLAVLGQMSASISHELNNPLAAIRSYADNARQFLKLDKSPQVDENLARIAALTEQMARISSQLKLFARKSSGRLEGIRVHPVIRSAIELVGPQYRQSGIRILHEQDDETLRARADAVQLEQVLINLINNAMNALEDSDDGLVSIQVRRNADKVLIDVNDNGPGIQQSDIGKIFDPFFTTRKSGLGLGLSISARIMELMRGDLTVQNMPAGSAQFTVSLQADKKDA
jgi:two-component system C4-dicarboxylate transport sensor histidine kinase DctB